MVGTWRVREHEVSVCLLQSAGASCAARGDSKQGKKRSLKQRHLKSYSNESETLNPNGRNPRRDGEAWAGGRGRAKLGYCCDVDTKAQGFGF